MEYSFQVSLLLKDIPKISWPLREWNVLISLLSDIFARIINPLIKELKHVNKNFSFETKYMQLIHTSKEAFNKMHQEIWPLVSWVKLHQHHSGVRDTGIQHNVGRSNRCELNNNSIYLVDVYVQPAAFCLHYPQDHCPDLENMSPIATLNRLGGHRRKAKYKS